MDAADWGCHAQERHNDTCLVHTVLCPLSLPQHCTVQVINIADTTAVAMLGAGGFGQVLLVKYQEQFTALKCISKAFVREQVGAGLVRKEIVSTSTPVTSQERFHIFV